MRTVSSDSRPDNLDDMEAEGSLWERMRVLVRASRGFWLVNSVNFGDGIAYFGMLALMTFFF